MHGTFNLGTDGTWTYVANSAFNELKVGDQLTDTFTVKAADGTSTSVTVTINGTNDKPVAYADTQTTEENTVLHGQVPVATDIDGTIASYQLATGIARAKATSPSTVTAATPSPRVPRSTTWPPARARTSPSPTRRRTTTVR
ncbi:VCBS domain-containing protein [Pseudomonas nitroreducens]|uniref:VCBS domain-containing protein n=1 Tax=Pseudomonas nitroreducens TaxID=46680 RepID=UPI0031F32DA1